MRNIQALFDKFVDKASNNLPTFEGFNQQTAMVWAILAVAAAILAVADALAERK